MLTAALLTACATEVADDPEVEQEPAIDAVGGALTNPLGQFAFWLDDPDPPIGQAYGSDSGYRLNVLNVYRTATGEYTAFLSEAALPSVAFAVAYGTDNTRCKVRSTEHENPYFVGTIKIFCHTPSGAAADSRFVLSGFVMGTDVKGKVAGGFVGENGTALETFSSKGSVSATRTAAGNYKISLGNLGSGARGGTILVGAYGRLEANTHHCKVVSWGAPFNDPTTQTIDVRCFATNSDTATDAAFWFLYDEEIPTKYNRGAYSWANNETSSSYQPDRFYTFMRGPSVDATSTSATGSLVSGETGRYKMVYHGLSEDISWKAYVHVGAYGSGSGYCKIRNWSRVSGCTSNCDIEVQTLCFDKAGNRKNMKYIQTWGSFQPFGPD